jgi:L-fuculose-phosphate aldolase
VTEAARTALCDAYRSLGRRGLIQGSSGNVSVRHGDGMLISPTGTTPERIDPARVVAMGLDSPAPGASSEWALHAALYRAAPSLGAVVHTHADACTALACLGEPLPAFHYMVAGFGGDDVRCAPYATFGTPALATAAAEAMRGRTACLLANHGMVAAGPTLEAAAAAAFDLEMLARQYLLARSAGSPRLLTPAQMAEARERYRTY